MQLNLEALPRATFKILLQKQTNQVIPSHVITEAIHILKNHYEELDIDDDQIFTWALFDAYLLHEAMLPVDIACKAYENR